MTDESLRPAISDSGWSPDLLKAHYDQRFIDQDKAVQAALSAADKAVQAALLAAKEAVTKAEIATEKRFDATNEFRQQLNDQAATFMPRAEAELRFKTLTERTDVNTSTLDRSGAGVAAGLQVRSDQRATIGQLLAGVSVLLLAIAIVASTLVAVLH